MYKFEHIPGSVLMYSVYLSLIKHLNLWNQDNKHEAKGIVTL